MCRALNRVLQSLLHKLLFSSWGSSRRIAQNFQRRREVVADYREVNFCRHETLVPARCKFSIQPEGLNTKIDRRGDYIIQLPGSMNEILKQATFTWVQRHRSQKFT
jgi:hypothetical protein